MDLSTALFKKPDRNNVAAYRPKSIESRDASNFTTSFIEYVR